MYKLVKASEASVRQIADKKTAANLITKEISPDFSLATTEAVDYYEEETTPYNRIYYVMEGSMKLVIGDDELEVEAGDACYIEKDTTYKMRGTFKAVVINQPAFGS
jgi:mannose-6-phosphate isomerase-like protein (cupin superfamily)